MTKKGVRKDDGSGRKGMVHYSCIHARPFSTVKVPWKL